MTNNLVRAGYNAIAERYAADRLRFPVSLLLKPFGRMVPAGHTVLDAGCGAGLPIDRFLIDRGLAVNGIDISQSMIALAQKNVPEAFYEIRDFSELAFDEYCVDGIVAFYALFHVPRTQHFDILRKFASYLPNGGPLLISMASSEWEGIADFHGVPMFWSHFGVETNTALVREAGFAILDNVIDRSAGEAHQIILAQR